MLLLAETTARAISPMPGGLRELALTKPQKTFLKMLRDMLSLPKMASLQGMPQPSLQP